jgi:UDP-N-acetyl-D-galactosamine dehydrogenase
MLKHKIINVIDALTDYGIVVTTHDPVANPKSVLKEYGMTTVVDVPTDKFDAVVLGVSHDAFLTLILALGKTIEYFI